MKKIIFIILPLLILSCAQKNDNRKVVVKDDHLTQAERIRNELDDYDRKDSLSQIAWGDIKFGISKKEVLKTDAFKGGSDYGSCVRMSYENLESLKSSMLLKGSLSHLEAVFEDNELTRIEIESFSVGRDEIRDLTHDCDIFVNSFENKYGKPYKDKKDIYMSDFKEDEEFEYVKFQIHKKFITISLGEKYFNSYGFQYYYKIDINNIDFPTTERYTVEKHAAAVREWEEQKAQKKKVLDSSF